jgi:asparagine synthase (glutamine-hydrolysing)
MCGIAGYIGQKENDFAEKENIDIASAIQYRGRDKSNKWTDGNCIALYHTRLSIIDVVNGDQPMISNDKNYVLVFNGEIYNYIELKEKYKKLGAIFNNSSDSEVIIEGFKLRGEKVCEDLNGMFAFAIWDIRKRELFLARDRLGKKPLFWCVINNNFYFSSSINSFKQIQQWDQKLSKVSLKTYEAFGCILEPMTIYERIFSLPVASFATVSPSKTTPEPRKYWRANYLKKEKLTIDEAIEKYETILTDAINIRLRSDVPIGLTFSGGVDSGTIAAICSRKLGHNIRCYTIDYNSKEDQSEETIIAKRVANSLDLPWTYINFDYHRNMLPALSTCYQNYDQPCEQISLIYSHQLYQTLKDQVTVVLSGNGADELFTGYIGDEKLARQDLICSATKPFRKVLSYTSVNPFLRMDTPEAFCDRLVELYKNTLNNDFDDELNVTFDEIKNNLILSGVKNRLDLSMYWSLNYRRVDSLYRVPDISGLASQVEVRSPYLDYRLIEFSASLPHKFKVGNIFSSKRNKLLPKLYYQNYIASDIVWSRKKGMASNIRWEDNIVNDEKYRKAFLSAYDRLDEFGIDSSSYRNAWLNYISDRKKGQIYSAHDDKMMHGFMLSQWLDVNHK